MNYFAKIKYLGTAFHGFQVQPSERTVQAVLCEALLGKEAADSVKKGIVYNEK